MLARAHTFTVAAPDVRHVVVEVEIRGGLPAFRLVGLADAAVREARERVAGAVRNSGYELPARRITANLAPADVRKAGPGLDLALACALLAASGQIPAAGLGRHALYGELGLDGGVRPARGTLAAAQCARERGLRAFVVAREAAREAALVDGLAVAGVGSLRSAARVLSGGAGDPLPAPRVRHGEPAQPALDLAEVRGQHRAVRALIVAAAGGHSILLSGPPGSGKTMLARRLPTLLPPLSKAEAIDVARIHEAASGAGLSRTRPFRAPHHSITAAALLGGSRSRGELVMARNGVLFLDELSAFTRAALEALRQPLEQPRFLLIAATVPCPCARTSGSCTCRAAELARHRRRLNGALLDRIDLLAELDQQPDLAQPPLTSSAEGRERVTAARERQATRNASATLNACLPPSALLGCARPDERGEQLLHRARERRALSPRAEHGALRVARTMADLAGRARVTAEDLAAALALRPRQVGP